MTELEPKAHKAALEAGRDAFLTTPGLLSKAVDYSVEAAIRAYIDALDTATITPERAVEGDQLAMIEQMIAGTAPMSKWVASVDYSTYDGFEDYLKAQLREKLHLKVVIDKDRAAKEELASFVDGGTAALEGALATYRVVRERLASPAVGQRETWQDISTAPTGRYVWIRHSDGPHRDRLAMLTSSAGKVWVSHEGGLAMPLRPDLWMPASPPSPGGK